MKRGPVAADAQPGSAQSAGGVKAPPLGDAASALMRVRTLWDCQSDVLTATVKIPLVLGSMSDRNKSP